MLLLRMGLLEGSASRNAPTWEGSCLNAHEVPRLHIPLAKKAHRGLSALFTLLFAGIVGEMK